MCTKGSSWWHLWWYLPAFHYRRPTEYVQSSSQLEPETNCGYSQSIVMIIYQRSAVHQDQPIILDSTWRKCSKLMGWLKERKKERMEPALRVNTLGVHVSNQQLLQGSDFFQMGWEALLPPTFKVRKGLMLIDFFFHVHARKQSNLEWGSLPLYQ